MNDHRQRKQLAMKKLDHLYTKGASPFSIPEPERKIASLPLGGFMPFAVLFFATVVSLGFVIPKINEALESGMIPATNVEATRTVMGLIPLMLVVATLLLIISNIMGKKED